MRSVLGKIVILLVVVPLIAEALQRGLLHLQCDLGLRNDGLSLGLVAFEQVKDLLGQRTLAEELEGLFGVLSDFYRVVLADVHSLV